MPEGDAIHRAAGRIRAALAGRAPERISTPQPRHRFERWPEKLAGRTLEAVDAHGKHLLLRFERGLTIHSHLRMSGSWSVRPEGEGSVRGAWLVLAGGGSEAVQYGGPVLELMSDARARTDPRLAALGPDVIGESFDERLFLRRLREDDPTRPIGDALLDQRTVAGIGNMWKAECCWAAELDPWRPTADVGDEQVLAAIAFAREEMTRSVRDGRHNRPHATYRQAGRPCPRCGATIRQRGQWEHNRVTFWCPSCQV
ncbi:MAG TPA: DNA-formamidopyrimidine glycosylase family protein [Solirubrobacteraceae bacterium]|nr:DNA-formamidopyrimidine glycosylase family protein [Solirubrobacteraceae bacterium]